MAKKIRVWDGSAWQDVAPALPYTAVHSAQASMPLTAVDGQIWLDTDASVPSTSVTRWYKLPAAGTTTLSGNDDNSIPLAYTPGYEQVFLNGTLLSRSAADYTATTGTSVVLSSAIVAGDIVEIICPLQITTTDTYTQSATNAAFQANTNNFAAGKNKIINGDFAINQRNFTSQTVGDSYGFDRWTCYNNGGFTITPQTFTLGAAPVAGYEAKNYLRAVTTGHSSATDFGMIVQKIEDVRTLAGQTVTMSFWAKAATGNPKIAVEFDQVTNVETLTYAGQVTISTSWARYSVTTTLPSLTGKTISGFNALFASLFLSAGSNFNSRTGSIGVQNNTFDIWGVQVEAGPNATAFQTATGTIQGELAACQRYYFRSYANSGYQRFGSGMAQSTTSVYTIMNLPVEMRTIPSSIDYPTVSTNFCVWDGVTITNCTAIGIDANSKNVIGITGTVSSGLTQYRNYQIMAQGSSTSAYIGVSAEL